MLNTAILCIVLIIASTLIHYETLSNVRSRLGKMVLIPHRAKIMVVILIAMVSHFLQIILFACVYYLLRDQFGLGSFGGQFQDKFFSFLYFSTETYTSLGFGDIYPLGALRLLTGIEALTGLVMIAWTASFTYLEMTLFWRNS